MIVRNLHSVTRIKVRILIRVTTPKLEYEEAWEGAAKSLKQLETAQNGALYSIESIVWNVHTCKT